MHSRSTLGALGLLLLLLICGGCDRGGGTVRHGSLSYNATEVFGEGTSALALAKAAGRGDVGEIDRLVAAGANINSVGRHNITPLWWAAWNRNYVGFKALLERGANPNAQRNEGYPIMHLLVHIDDVQFLKSALEHKGDPDLPDLESGFALLFEAILSGNEEHANLLLGAGANANAQMPVSGSTLPMTAIGATANYELAYKLIQKGADPTTKDVHGTTLADTIAIVSRTASNNNDPYREKILELLTSKGVTLTTNTISRLNLLK